MRRPALVSRRRRGLASTLAAALVATPLAAGLTTPAAAVSPNIVISDVYGGGGNTGAVYDRDYVELYNPTASSVALTGLSLQGRAATGSPAGTLVELTGSIPSGGTYVVATSPAGPNGSPLPSAPPQSATWTLGATGGQVLLVSGTTSFAGTGDLAGNASLVDMVGWGTTGSGNAATSFETAAGAVTSSSTALVRTKKDADNNFSEFAAAAPTPGTAPDLAEEPTTLTATDPGAKSGIVGQALTPFTLQAAGGTAPYTWASSTLPPGVTISTAGQVSGTPTTTGTSTVTATVTDSATPTAASDDVTFSFTVTEPPAPIAVAEIQGTGPATSLPSATPVTTEGVVTASYPTGGLNGFYIQTPGPDTTPDASDALFVYGTSAGFATYPTVGQSVRVTGTPGEFGGQTQLTTTSWAAVSSLGTVVEKTRVPGTECALPGTSCQTVAQLAPARERMEGELVRPTTSWTVTDSYDGSPDLQQDGRSDGRFLGELAVAAGSDDPLVAPTEVIDAQDAPAIEERKRYNAAHRLILDDASSWTYSTSSHPNDPLPWFTADHTVRTGAGITFVKPVVFTERFGSWRVLPQQQVVGKPTGLLEFEQTRPAAPQPVGGDVKLATFNVLSFFPTTGEEYEAAGLGTCSYYTDRSGARTNVNSCNPDGPRGAANDISLVRQRNKIVRAINTADADIVSLEELENSVKFNKPRDFAIDALVAALNADAGAGTWAAVPSAPTLPPTAEQDVIRNGFIYQPANVALVGDSAVLSDQSATGEAFEDAREPLAQAFKQTGTPDSAAFAVIVNHFKSKGSGTPDPDGQGNANERRELQAAALATFADQFKAQRSLSKVFLTGDFNAYSEEDPIQILEGAGYTSLDSTSDPEEESYSFDGMVGSLDHVLANAAALPTVAKVDMWDINAYESVYYEYARFNTNVTNLYAPNPFRSSDHNPEIVGIRTAVPSPGKAKATIKARVKPRRIVARKTRAKVVVRVSADGYTPTGRVRVRVAGRVYRVRLEDGRAVVRLKKLPRPRVYRAKIRYLGDADTEPARTSVRFTVRRR